MNEVLQLIGGLVLGAAVIFTIASCVWVWFQENEMMDIRKRLTKLEQENKQ